MRKGCYVVCISLLEFSYFGEFDLHLCVIFKNISKMKDTQSIWKPTEFVIRFS